MIRLICSAAGRPLNWLLVPLALAACNLNTTADEIPQVSEGPPVVQIAAPLPNATFLQGVGVNIQARVSNAGADISRVEVAVDDAVVASLDSPNESGAPAFSVAHTWRAETTGTHTISVTAFRGDDTASAPASVTVNVVGQGGGAAATPTTSGDSSDTSGASGGQTTAPQATARPTDPPAPTNPPAPTSTATPSVPTASFTTGVNVRRGPGTVFEPPIGSFAANQTSEVLAVSPDRQWYKVRYYNSEGWVFASLMSISGDTGNLPVDPGPPTPVPATPTPIPPTPVPFTNTPSLNINLVAGNIRLDPAQPRCAETFNIFIDVLNSGSDRWNGGGIINISDTASGNTTGTIGAIPAIDPGQTVAVGPIPLTVSTNYEEEHTIVADINPDNQVPETSKDDNRREFRYTLRRGNC